MGVHGLDKINKTQSNSTKKLDWIGLLGEHSFKKRKTIQNNWVIDKPTKFMNYWVTIFYNLIIHDFDVFNLDFFNYNLLKLFYFVKRMILTYLGCLNLIILTLILVSCKYLYNYKYYRNVTLIFSNMFKMNFIVHSYILCLKKQ